MEPVNHQVRLAARPTGIPNDSDWELTSEPVPQPDEGEFVVKISYLSIDPAMRGWMSDAPSYVPPVEMGALGLTGLTAYFGLLDVGRLADGETVLVSGAAGAVGSVAGQIAKLKRCTVIGVAGGPDKCRWIVDELGFDAAIDYQSVDVRRALREYSRLDVYFDNVGGEILDAALTRLARGARIVICGGISQYNAERRHGPANYLALIPARGTMTGMLVFDYADRYPEAMAQLGRWLAEGKLVSREHVVSGGVSAFPQTLLKLFAGENTGKMVLAI